jgi:hypothetical protein
VPAEKVGTVRTTVSGSVLVPVRVDLGLLTTTLKYSATAGRQKPERFEGGPTDVLTASLNGELLKQLGWTATLIQTNEEAVEVNAVA